MIKRISILIRRQQDDREAFRKHWHGMHGALVAKLPAIGRYIQNHVIDEFSTAASGSASYEIDGFVELYFSDDAAMRGAFSGQGRSQSGPMSQISWDIRQHMPSAATDIPAIRSPTQSFSSWRPAVVPVSIGWKKKSALSEPHSWWNATTSERLFPVLRWHAGLSRQTCSYTFG
jgi:uncharacterized protein (TIGR02118 family)